MGLENISQCLLCGSENFSEYLRCEDHFVTHEIFSISKCNECGFCFTNPRPSIDAIGPYYESEEYVSHSKSEQGLTNRLFHLSRKLTIRSKAKTIQKHVAGLNLLDYGSGTGEFLHFMKTKGYNVSGIESSALARHHAIDTYGLHVADEDGLEKIPNESLDAITLWHVLEHIYPLEQRLQQFNQKLNAVGTLFVALPNMNAYDAKKYGKFWAAFDTPRHLYHFTPATIKSLVEKFGFSLISNKAMYLDAFYISLLSEKYSRGSPKYFQAFFSGMKSNILALTGKRNYSSLIYIFKKSK